MTPDLLIQGTHGRENAEKANLPFIVGNVAAGADQDVVVLLTSEAVWLATKGYADDIEYGGYPPVGEMIARFILNEGAVWACSACTEPRGIDAAQLIDGVSIVTATSLTDAMQEGVRTLGF